MERIVSDLLSFKAAQSVGNFEAREKPFEHEDKAEECY